MSSCNFINTTCLLRNTNFQTLQWFSLSAQSFREADQKATRKADRVDAEVWFLRAQFAFAVETWGTASIHINAGSDPTKIVVAAARRHPHRCRRAVAPWPV